MTTAILIAILCFEIIRLVLYVQDSRRLRKSNQRVEEHQKGVLEFSQKMDADWKRIRETEIEELRQLAKESDTMKRIYDEWVDRNIKEKEG